MNRLRIAKLYPARPCLALIGVGLAGTSQPIAAINLRRQVSSSSIKAIAQGLLARHKFATAAVATTALAATGIVALLVVKKINDRHDLSMRNILWSRILEIDENGCALVYDKEGKWLANVELKSNEKTGPVVETANDCPWMIGPCIPIFPVYNNLGELVGDIETSTQSWQANGQSKGKFIADSDTVVRKNSQFVLPTPADAQEDQSSLPVPAVMPSDRPIQSTAVQTSANSTTKLSIPTLSVTTAISMAGTGTEGCPSQVPATGKPETEKSTEKVAQENAKKSMEVCSIDAPNEVATIDLNDHHTSYCYGYDVYNVPDLSDGMKKRALSITGSGRGAICCDREGNWTGVLFMAEAGRYVFELFTPEKLQHFKKVYDEHGEEVATVDPTETTMVIHANLNAKSVRANNTRAESRRMENWSMNVYYEGKNRKAGTLYTTYRLDKGPFYMYRPAPDTGDEHSSQTSTTTTVPATVTAAVRTPIVTTPAAAAAQIAAAQALVPHAPVPQAP